MATANAVGTPGKFLAEVQKMIAGVTQVIPAKSSINLGGAQNTQAQILTQLEAIVTEYQTLATAKAAYSAQLLSTRNERKADNDLLKELRGAVIALLGRQNPQLTQFGINPVKPRVTTAQQKVAAAAKRAVTRAKRNTMGKVQKADVKAIQTPDVSLSNGKQSITPLAADAATTPSVGDINGGAEAPSSSAPAAASSTASTASKGATGTATGGTTGSTATTG